MAERKNPFVCDNGCAARGHPRRTGGLFESAAHAVWIPCYRWFPSPKSLSAIVRVHFTKATPGVGAAFSTIGTAGQSRSAFSRLARYGTFGHALQSAWTRHPASDPRRLSKSRGGLPKQNIFPLAARLFLSAHRNPASPPPPFPLRLKPTTEFGTGPSFSPSLFPRRQIAFRFHGGNRAVRRGGYDLAQTFHP